MQTYCAKCGVEIYKQRKICPQCEDDNSDEKESSFRNEIIIVVIILMGVLLVKKGGIEILFGFIFRIIDN